MQELFQGEVSNGEIGNRGTYHWPDGSVYEGDLLHGLRNGYGRFFDAESGSFYSGNWLASHIHGYVSDEVEK